jgi:hypothetical protein
MIRDQGEVKIGPILSSALMINQLVGVESSQVRLSPLLTNHQG